MIFMQNSPFSPLLLDLPLTFFSIHQGIAAFFHVISFIVQLGLIFHLTLVDIR